MLADHVAKAFKSHHFTGVELREVNVRIKHDRKDEPCRCFGSSPSRAGAA
jgi:hypothetical protein